ncbi:MAG TPA: glycosyltransferase family 2 protein [Candidatus Saccharimonadales bacterium]|nr:glycosyltransferase family 2 protein [Candidatus Saccharimonadales bacterium]
MNTHVEPDLSVVVPVYNEAAGLYKLYVPLKAVLDSLDMRYELIFVDDGSTDGSAQVMADMQRADGTVRVLTFTRNFGKEMATTAGLHNARGQAIITLDADGQHPVDRIPAFVARWQRGAKLVVGRRSGRRMGVGKRLSTGLFYSVFRRLTGIRVDSNTSDFRLIDKDIQTQFNKLTEHNRMTKALIDWLGYPREYVSYHENARQHGAATYSYRKLFKLAIDSAVSLSISPLYITAYAGAVVLPLATLLGLGMIVNYFLRDPLHLHATGSAYIMVLVLFLVGILMVSQGIIGLYLSHIHSETQNRPLYVIDNSPMRGKA